MPWVNRSTTPDPGTIAGAIGASDRIYVARGQDASNDPNTPQQWRILQFVVSTNTWTSRAIDSTTNRGSPAVAYQAGKVYLIGGVGPAGGDSSLVRIWDPVANTWAGGTAMTTAKTNCVAQAYSTTKILVFGGTTGGTASTAVYEYDTTAATWTTKTAASSTAVNAWASKSSTIFFWNNRVYLRNAGMSFSVFRTDTNAWLSDQTITMAHGLTNDQFTSNNARAVVAATTQGSYLYHMQRLDTYTYLFAVTDLSTWKTYGPHVYARPVDAGIIGPTDWDLAADTVSMPYSGTTGGVFWYGAATGSSSAFMRWRPGDLSAVVMPTPTPNGSSVQTDTPSLALGSVPSAIVTTQPGYVQFQLASDSGFTANVKTVDDLTDEALYSFSQLDTVLVPAGAHQVMDFSGDPPLGFGFDNLEWWDVVEPVPGGSALSTGTWYLRCRYVVPPDEVGPWTTGVSFTVSHQPSASGVYPNGGENIQYGAFNFTWNFDDPYNLDTQSAYQIIVERTDTGATVLDTTKTASVSARSYNWTPSSTLKDILLRWKIRVWDSDDTTAGYSSYRTFRVADLPVVTVTGPAEGGVIATAKPTVTWTFSAGGGRIQNKYKVRILNGATEVYTSGWVASTALTHTPPNNILQNGITYTAEVTVEDSYGLQRTDTNNFTTSYTPPAQPAFTVSTSVYDSTGPVRITWTNALKDAQFIGWNVYRRLSNGTEWTLVYSTTTDQASYTVDDYTAGSGVQYVYTVVQVASRFGSGVESNKTTTSTVTPTSGEYWLIVPDQPSLNQKLYIVTDDEFSSDVEQEETVLIDRGRHVDYGTDMGYSGSLTCRLVDMSGGPTARTQRLNIEAIRIARLTALLRNPFGDVFEVAVGSIQFKRQPGVGLTEMGDITIPYAEVMS